MFDHCSKGTAMFMTATASMQVENMEALRCFDSIAGAADAIILSRGNLGLDVAPEKTAVVQKAAVNRCNLLVPSPCCCPIRCRSTGRDLAMGFVQSNDGSSSTI